jgi:glucosamine-6-phosphate deaminase
MITEFRVDLLCVKVFADRDSMGKAAALDVSEEIKRALNLKGDINMIFAAAPSQNELLNQLSAARDIMYPRITAFHMDEYIGLPDDAEQRFGNFLKQRLFARVQFKQVHLLQPSDRDPEEECRRYSSLLKDITIDIVCMGIGENGHLAFNDPYVADFSDPLLVKVVELDEQCRLQQVHDKCFPCLEQVPAKAITLTIPAVFSAKFVCCVVPGRSKAEAVENALTKEIAPTYPASILRRHPHAILFLDRESAARAL